MDNQTGDQKPTPPDSLHGPVPQTTIQPGSKPTIPTYDEPKGTIDLRPKRKKRRILIIILILLLVVVGGWFAYKKFFEDKNVAPTTQSKEVEQINIGMAATDFGDLYPNITPSSYSILTNAQMFEGLVRYEKKSKIVPLLATDWSNPDSNTWVFNLKSDILFHNGNTMKADDVKYSIDKIKDSGSEYASIFTSTIDSVNILNENQVEIKTKEPDRALLNRLAFVYIIDNEAAADSEPSQAGTGAYVIKPGTKPTTQSVQLTAYDNYHGGKPKTKAINFNSEESIDTLAKAYSEGKYSIAEIPVGKAENIPTVAQFVTNEPEIFYLGLNTIKPGPLQKKEVREALRYAVDPVVLGTAMDDRVTPLNQLIPESIPGFNPAIPTYQRDVNKSRELLASAGYPDGLTLKFSHSSTQAMSDELSKQLKEAGITLEIDFHNDFDEFIDYFAGGNAEMYSIIYTSDILDGLDMYQTTLPPEYYSTPELDNVLGEAGATVDPEPA